VNAEKDLEDVRGAEEIQKEIVEGRKALFNYYFSLLTHIDSKISNFLSVILITESVIVAYGGAIIKWLGINWSTFIPIVCLLISGIFLAISGLWVIATMKPKDIHLPNYISDFETLEKGRFYKEQLRRIERAIKKDIELLEKNAKRLKYISCSILFSIVLLLTSLFFLLFFSWNYNFSPLSPYK
jgi:hypothetical protein